MRKDVSFLREQNLMDYRQRNKIFSPEKQSELTFEELTESKRMLIEQRVKVRMVDYLNNYLSDVRNTDEQVSLSLGIEEPSLAPLIAEFNKLQQEKALSLKTIPAGNPRIRQLEAAITKLRQDLLETLRNVRITQQQLLKELEKQYAQSENLLNTIPEHEKQTLEMARKQDILRELFQFLYEKKVETSIARASTISNIRVMESAMLAGGIVSPNKKNIYLMAFLLGLGIPAAIIFLVDYLNDKVRSRSDVQDMTDTPILGEIGHAEKTDNSLIVSQRARTVIAEQFRIMRSNLSYILPQGEKPVILVTSTFSGEGKSFISTNLGAVMALAGKKTVILEFDIRKPKILSGLGLPKAGLGITSFVIGKSTLEDIVQPIPGIDNLFVIPCGAIPPNPGEMMLSPKIAELFQWLNEQFDIIVVDTAPIGLVSDSLILSQFANTVAYVVRHNYTSKKQLLFLDELYRNKKLPKLSLVINDAKASASYGGYAYGGYGYGYGYGYGQGYYEDEKKVKPWYKKILSFFHLV
jgi:capsular exopolysaccharide synthesis family protein